MNFQYGKTVTEAIKGTPVEVTDFTMSATPIRSYIGKNNLQGRLRYRYYKKRGWVTPNGISFKPTKRWRHWLATKLLHVLTDDALKRELLHRDYIEMTLTALQDGKTVEYKAICERTVQ